MAFVLADRVKETTIVVGTGAATLLGASSGYQSFSAGVGASNTTYYTIADQSGSNWEVGYGTLDATGLILTRTTVLSSSNSGSAVSFTAGTKDVWCDYTAKKAVIQDSLGTATVPQLATNSYTSITPVLSFNASNSPFASGASVSGSYLQTLLQNKSGTAGASTNYVLSNDLGTDSTYYGEFGMNSSVYSSGTPADFFSINNGIYFSGHDGDISFGSGNGYKTYFAWGTTGQSAHVINASGAIGLSTNLGTTPALSGTTGYGTSGQVLTSGGSAAAPTWTTVTSGITITDNTSSSSTYYPAMTTATSGTITGETTSSTKLSFVPSTGTLTTSALTLAGTATLPGTTSALAAILTNAAEVCTVSATAATGTIAYYPSTQSVLYYTSNASANWTTNFTFSSGTTLNTAMATGQSLTVAFLVTQGATAYYNNVVQVDGTTTGVTTKWQGSAAPTAGNASSVDVYTYTIVKTGSATFTVFATQTQFK